VKIYDPAKAPDPAEWLDMDEQERISLVEAHHRAAKIKLPNVKLHAAFHAAVENQLAEGLTSPGNAMTRLQKEGLSRHDALHAVAAVISDHLYGLMKDPALASSSQARLDATLEKLTVKEWRRKYGGG